MPQQEGQPQNRCPARESPRAIHNKVRNKGPTDKTDSDKASLRMARSRRPVAKRGLKADNRRLARTRPVTLNPDSRSPTAAVRRLAIRPNHSLKRASRSPIRLMATPGRAIPVRTNRTREISHKSQSRVRRPSEERQQAPASQRESCTG